MISKILTIIDSSSIKIDKGIVFTILAIQHISDYNNGHL